MNLKDVVKTVVRKCGIDVFKYPTRDLKRRALTYKTFGIDTLIDVGANTGQYASQARVLGYNGRIISFEPTSAAFNALSRRAKNDSSWEIYKSAVGAQQGEIQINISENSYSSSILGIKELHVQSAPASRYISTETVPIDTLDNLLPALTKERDSIYLKIDTQGYEKEVLKGAERSMAGIKCIQLEIGLVELYDGETLFEDMLAYLKQKGFHLYVAEPEFFNSATGQLLQIDAIFYNKRLKAD